MPSALIAEDEPLLAAALQHELQQAWPTLDIVASVGDGLSAVREALRLTPEVLFLDIRMPGQSGLEAAVELADAWPADAPFPVLVFVTAYDQYAVQAFEAQAVDYLLKPVQPERLRKTVARLQQALQLRGAPAAPPALEQALAQLRQLVQVPGLAPAQPSASAPLTVIQASRGNQILMVPLEEVLYFEAADKYVRVLTARQEYLIRTPLKELQPRLDPAVFWQVHRGTLVRASAIASTWRDEAGRLQLQLRERPERLAVSRLYAPLFKAM
ncbi:LytR/AlgR family response regulator transcription factor [Alicycliphilus denitrificans]|uniref:LytR/AlgR family response regulator transcription factor n=1 Tax=Alicycliphilus denitrificans TaxID=179636 RepID=UPI00384DC78E